MEQGLLATTKEFISEYWPHVSGGAVAVAATVGTAIFAYIRRPKSSPTDAGPCFTDAALLSPPLTRPTYSDRMAYVLAEMSGDGRERCGGLLPSVKCGYQCSRS